MSFVPGSGNNGKGNAYAYGKGMSAESATSPGEEETTISTAIMNTTAEILSTVVNSTVDYANSILNSTADQEQTFGTTTTFITTENNVIAPQASNSESNDQNSQTALYLTLAGGIVLMTGLAVVLFKTRTRDIKPVYNDNILTNYKPESLNDSYYEQPSPSPIEKVYDEGNYQEIPNANRVEFYTGDVMDYHDIEEQDNTYELGSNNEVLYDPASDEMYDMAGNNLNMYDMAGDI